MIRDATPDDVPAIADMIRRFAEHEDVAEQLALDEQLLREHLFGEQPSAVVILAEEPGPTEKASAVGFALYFAKYSTLMGQPGLYLEDLYVLASHRGRGHGRALLAHLAGVAAARGYARLEWSVLDGNGPAISFYRALGAVPMDDRTTYRLAGEPLAALASSSRQLPIAQASNHRS